MAETKDELPAPFSRFQHEPGMALYSGDQMHAFRQEGVAAAQSRINALLEEVEVLRKKAERYEWLRDSAMYAWPFGDGPDMVWCVIGSSGYDNRPADGSELDAAIDAAMSAGRSGSGEASNG